MKAEHIEKILQQSIGKQIIVIPEKDPILFMGRCDRASEVGDNVWTVTGSGAVFQIAEAVTKYFEPSDLVSIAVVGQVATAGTGLVQPPGNARIRS